MEGQQGPVNRIVTCSSDDISFLPSEKTAQHSHFLIYMEEVCPGLITELHRHDTCSQLPAFGTVYHFFLTGSDRQLCAGKYLSMVTRPLLPPRGKLGHGKRGELT